MNVAYHLKQLGLTPLPLTAVGRDQLGDELLRRMTKWGISTQGICVNSAKPTGMARVILVDGSPKFEIVEDVAWDWIEIPAEVRLELSGAKAVVFGSLAQRSENNCRQLGCVLDVCTSALKVFDVNLRAPYDSLDLVWALSRRADLIKLSDGELCQLLERKISPSQFAAGVQDFVVRTGVSKVCLTAGGAGAGLFLNGEWYWEPAQPVNMRDSVGAGDSFLAGLLHGLLVRAENPSEVLQRAARLAEFVVTQDGATPDYKLNEVGLPVAPLSK